VLEARDEGGGVSLLDAEDGRLLAAFRAHEDAVAAIQFAPDGSCLLTAGADGVVRQWTGLGTRRGQWEGRRGAVAFSPDGTLVAMADRRSEIEFTARVVWQRLEEGARRDLLAAKGLEVTALAFSPDGRTLAVSSPLDTGEERVWLWDLDSRRVVGSLAPPAHVMVMAFSSDSALLATGEDMKGLRVWDVASRRQRRELMHERTSDRVHAVAFSPDGTTLYGGGRFFGLRAWDVRSGRARTLLGGGLTVTTLAVSPDGERLACLRGGWDLSLQVIETANGRLLWSHP
jgi:WD40 repeat protein